MTIGEWVERGAEELARAGIADARLEAQLLFCHVFGVDRAGLLTRLADEPTQEQRRAFGALLMRRHRREPLAYITGSAPFFGLDLAVDRRVLVPRPETEVLVEKILQHVQARFVKLSRSPSPPRSPSPVERGMKKEAGGVPQSPVREGTPHLISPKDKFRDEFITITDVGTGSGAIAVALAVNLPQATVYATDCSPDALAVAEANCKRHGMAERVRLLHGDLLAPLPGPVDIVAANLPYIPTQEITRLQPEIAWFEPREALDGGRDGLDAFRALLSQAPAKLKPGGALFLEIGHGQAQAVYQLVAQRLPSARVAVTNDLAGIPRVVAAFT